MIETVLNVPNLIVDIRNNSNDTALDLALYSCKKVNFDLLFNKFVKTEKINTFNKRGICYLSHAVKYSTVEFVKHMIADLSFDPNDNGNFEEENPDLKNYPLHQAIISKRHDMLKYLLSLSNIDVNIKDKRKNGDSALHIACKQPNFQAVCILIDSKKVDINIKNDDGDNCLMDMIREYHKKKDDVISHKLEYFQILFYIINQESFNMNDRGKNGESILHLIRNNKEILLKLKALQLKIDTNIKDDFGKTAIDYLLEEYPPKYDNTIAILMYGNYNINKELVQSEIIFYILQKMPFLELFIKFVNNGLDLNAVSKEGILNLIFFLIVQ